MTAIRPSVLVLSSRHDYSADYVVARLHERRVPYLRLNSDEFTEMELTLFPTDKRLVGSKDGREFVISADQLRSVYFRCPVFLRETTTRPYDFVRQLSIGQWASFTRGLMVFDTSLWVNHPQATYLAETKPFQLSVAQAVGFRVPQTVVANTSRFLDHVTNGQSDVVVKGVDTVLLRDGNVEAFGYTNLLDRAGVRDSDLSSAPAILQRALHGKTDIRVTVVGGIVFAVKIVKDGLGVEGDWRRQKDNVVYPPISLPGSVADACKALVRRLGLVFGAIDIAVMNGEYYFIEINPTGEWAWLTAQSDLPIDHALTDVLVDHKLWW